MTKRLVYILFLLLVTARLLAANPGHVPAYGNIIHLPVLKSELPVVATTLPPDTTRVKAVPQARMEVGGPKKIKEIAKPKHQSKPEKVVTPVVDTAAVNKKAKRQRRPEGLERPPEIPRRNND